MTAQHEPLIPVLHDLPAAIDGSRVHPAAPGDDRRRSADHAQDVEKVVLDADAVLEQDEGRRALLVELELDGRSVAAGLGAVAASLEMSGTSTAGVVLI